MRMILWHGVILCIIIRLQMKGRKMYAPAANELFQQKLLYQSHLKKLEKIREERKNQLAFDPQRIQRHQEIRTSKSRSFAHRYNEQHHEIAQQNVKLLNKLEHVRPFTRHSSFSTHEQDADRTSITPFRKRRQIETQKENSRIFVKVRSVSSNLSKDKLLRDYAKSQQIRARIARYATQNNKIALKSEQFVSVLDRSVQQEKPSTASHYRPTDILRNRIGNPVQEIKKRGAETERDEREEIFPTEPARLRQRTKKYHI